MASDWQIGERIENRWEIHNILRGGMGIVYVVYDHERREVFAAKTFQDEKLARNPGLADRFTLEARTWVNLDVHQNVVQARFVENIRGKPFLFLEYVSGGDLSKWIATPRLTQDLPQVLRFAIQFCDGMNHALSKGIQAHRDIKPENCLVTQDNNLKVTDFGLAKVFDDAPMSEGHGAGPASELGIHLSRTGECAGTWTHMAPEQFRDAKHVDMRADIYSFGVMLFQMVTGRLPFVGRTWEEFKRLHSEATPPPLQSGQLSLDCLVRKCLAKAAGERYADFGTLREELATIYERMTNQPAPKPPSGRELEAYELRYKGSSLGSLGRHEEALGCYDRALDVYRQHAAVLDEQVRLGTNKETLAGLSIFIGREEAGILSFKGLTLSSLGRHKEALACCERSVALDPQDAVNWCNRAVTLGRVGRYEEALACCDRALALNPQLAETWSNKGRMLRHLGRYEEALACFTRALAINPQDPDAWYDKGVMAGGLGRGEEASACFDRALAVNPKFASAWFNKGAVLLNQFRRAREAIHCFEEAQRLGDPEAAQAKAAAERIARIAIPREGSPATSESVTEPRVPEPTTGRELGLIELCDKGQALANLGRPAEALTCFDRALALNPQYAEAWCNKGNALSNLGRHEEAVACYDRGLAIKPQLAGAWCRKGNALGSLGRHGEALACYDRALSVNPRFAEAWGNKSATLVRLGRHEEALTCCDRALAVNHGLAGAWYNKGLALCRLGRYEEALPCYDRFLTASPQDEVAWFNKGLTLMRLARSEEALSCYDRALAVNPQCAEAWFNKGGALWRLGRHGEALSCYDRALALNPQDPEGWYNKGLVLAKDLKRAREAIACFEQAQRLGFPQAAQAIAMCRKFLGG